ncbi:MAG: type VI secretion system tube protein TssD [Phycisphaerales bacterium]
MRSQKTLVPLAACAAVVLGFSLVANSGPLNPPAGPVAPTGRTLNEIYNAVQAVGTGGPSAVEPVAEVREVFTVTITGQFQGNIDGEDTVFGFQNVIKSFGIEHEIVVPIDAASGLPTGQPQHGALTITKQVDRASPLLAQMATTLEECEATIRMFKENTQTGLIQHYYTITLRDAFITRIVSTHTDVSADRITHEEAVSITYQRIDWTHEVAGTMGSATTGGPGG